MINFPFAMFQGQVDIVYTEVPAIPTKLYGGSYGASGGVYTSSNNGTTWSPTLYITGLGNLYVQWLAAQPNTFLWAGTDGGVYRTSLTGSKLSWVSTTSGITSGIRSIHYFPTITYAKLWVGTDGGIFSSSNNGVTWGAASVGLGTGAGNGLKNTYHIVQYGESWLFAATLNGIYRTSLTGSAVWVQLTGGGYYFLGGVDAGSYIYMGGNNGIYRSNDSGSTWSISNTTNGLPNIYSMKMAVTGSTVITTTNGGGMATSSVGVATWVAVNTGLPASAAPGFVKTHFPYVWCGVGSTFYTTTIDSFKWTGSLQSNVVGYFVEA